MTPSRLYHGTLPPNVWLVLEYAYERGGIWLQSDFARTFAVEVALAASCGWLTTISPDGKEYGKLWRITAAGLMALNNKEKF